MTILIFTSGLLTRFPVSTRQNLLGIYMFKDGNKNRTRYETCIKLKLKNKYTKKKIVRRYSVVFVIFEPTLYLVLVFLLLHLII